MKLATGPVRPADGNPRSTTTSSRCEVIAYVSTEYRSTGEVMKFPSLCRNTAAPRDAAAPVRPSPAKDNSTPKMSKST